MHFQMKKTNKPLSMAEASVVSEQQQWQAGDRKIAKLEKNF